MGKREFRSAESIAFEVQSRDLVRPFLSSRGIIVASDVRRTTGTAISQTIWGRLPDGENAVIRVKLCWRRDARNPREMLYSAAQLVARRLESGWDETLAKFVERNSKQGITHLLLAQPEPSQISLAALVPLDLVPSIWWAQYEVSKRLIAEGRLGRTKKNHAANGRSPTLWLQDDRSEHGHLVAEALWSYEGIVDLRQPLRRAPSNDTFDDTFDDCPGIESEVGRDEGVRTLIIRSAVARDRAVREQVRLRAGGACERCGCSRSYPSFLDVHHVMGVEKSDRVWTCVALCPNCHREAHCSPTSALIRAELSAFAMQFKKP